jgi:hypothetical protein
MGTNRTPLRREFRRRITPDAIAAFRASDEAALHLALRLPPWHISPLTVGDGPSPYPPNAMGRETWAQAQELRRALEEAADGN